MILLTMLIDENFRVLALWAGALWSRRGYPATPRPSQRAATTAPEIGSKSPPKARGRDQPEIVTENVNYVRRDKEKIAGLVLAAGYSSRMGDFKPLLPFGDSTVVERAASTFIKAGVYDVSVVVGWRANDLIPLLDRLGVQAILNPQYGSGMYSSVIAGVRSLSPNTEAFLLLPGDYPLVKPRTVQKLIQRYLEGRAKIVNPRFSGRRGHPPLIAVSCIDRDSSFDQPAGLKAVLSRYGDEAVDVEVADQGILMDVDTPEDYQRALETLTKG